MTTLRLPPSVTHLNADAIALEYLTVMRAHTGPVTTIDASQMLHFDSSLLALFLTVIKNMQERNGVLRITGLSQRAKALAHVYGIGELLPA